MCGPSKYERCSLSRSCQYTWASLPWSCKHARPPLPLKFATSFENGPFGGRSFYIGESRLSSSVAFAVQLKIDFNTVFQGQSYMHSETKMNADKCPVCATQVTENPRLCEHCGAVHHRDCWDYCGDCAMFLCLLGRAEGKDKDEKAAVNLEAALNSWAYWYSIYSICFAIMAASYTIVIPLVATLFVFLNTALRPLFPLPAIAIAMLWCVSMAGLFGSVVAYALARSYGSSVHELLGQEPKAQIAPPDNLSKELNLSKVARSTVHYVQQYRAYAYFALLFLIFVFFPFLSFFVGPPFNSAKTILLEIFCFSASSYLYCYLPFESTLKQLRHVSSVRNRMSASF